MGILTTAPRYGTRLPIPLHRPLPPLTLRYNYHPYPLTMVQGGGAHPPAPVRYTHTDTDTGTETKENAEANVPRPSRPVTVVCEVRGVVRAAALLYPRALGAVVCVYEAGGRRGADVRESAAVARGDCGCVALYYGPYQLSDL